MNDILPPKKNKKKSSGGLGLKNKQNANPGLQGIMEEKVGDEDVQSDEASQQKGDGDNSSGGSSGSDSDSGDSSIDMDGEDEDKMYQNVLKE